MQGIEEAIDIFFLLSGFLFSFLGGEREEKGEPNHEGVDGMWPSLMQRNLGSFSHLYGMSSCIQF